MNNEQTPQRLTTFHSALDSAREAMVLMLIALFVLLYTSVLTGWFKPVSDLGFLTRIEPIIFLIIGYYFGRFPSERNEKTLKDEIARHIRRADAAEQYVAKLLCEREMLEERIRNTKSILMPLKVSQREASWLSGSETKLTARDGRLESALRVLVP